MAIKRYMSFLLVLAMAMFCIAGFAQAEGKGRVEFEALAPDDEGYFTVVLTAYDVEFSSFQFALRYNRDVAVPVNAESGEAVTTFDDFAECKTGCHALLGLKLDTDSGYIAFSGYIPPGNRGDGLSNSEGVITASSSGVQIMVFHFKKIAKGDIALELATKDKGEPYDVSLPNGAVLVCQGQEVDASLVFDMSDVNDISKNEGVSDMPKDTAVNESGSTVDDKKEDALTREERIKDTVILQIGNYAAVVDGELVNIYPGETDVVPYLKNDRTFVPIRFISERLGANVSWEEDSRTVVIVKDGKTIRMPVGANTYTINGEEYAMDAAAEIKQDRTFVPIRFVAETLERDVQWSPSDRMVIISPFENPWQIGGEVETELMNDINLLLSPLLKLFI